MIKYLLAFVFVFCCISEGFSQKELNEYSFVVVPEKFDFVSEVDKYQLNSLTRHLFNKHGFNAYFDRELPDVRRCDGLWAKVDGKPGIIWTKVTVILNDCRGNEVYRSEVGKSKIKQYNKTYIAALRDAFLSIEALGVEQRNPQILQVQIVEATSDEEGKHKKEFNVNADRTEDGEDKAVKEVKDIKIVNNIGETSEEEATKYTRNNENFYLVKVLNGYYLFASRDFSKVEKRKGEIVPKNSGNYEFIDSSGNKFPCSFDRDQNLIIETSFQKLVFTKSSQ